MHSKSQQYSIRINKQNFNFAASHFLIFKDGTREPLHGHNYRVRLKGHAMNLQSDMVFDFLDIKPIVREVCQSLDHKTLIPKGNPQLEIFSKNSQYEIKTPDGSFFSLPQSDVLLLPISNTSAERLAIYIANQVHNKLKEKFQFSFEKMEVEVEETPGQSAQYLFQGEDL